MSRAPGVLSRDVAALSAFGAVAVSGVLPLPILVIFPVVFVVSLLGYRPLAGRRVASVIVLLLLAVMLFGSVWFSLLDLVVAAVSFATLVTCHRMLAEPTPQASRQVLLSGLLLVAGGAALTGEALFAFLLVAFFFAASWSMAWLVLARDDAQLEAPERRAISRQLFSGAVATLLMGLVFFVLFPRLSWNLANRRSAPGLGGVTGMSDTVKLGGGGDIKTSARVAFRVALAPEPGVEQLNGYFVGRHFDAFDGLEWKSTGTPGAPQAWINLRRAGRRLKNVTQEYELTSAYGSRTLVALDTPTTFTRARALNLSGSQQLPLVHVPDDQVFGTLDANLVTYTANSDLAPQLDRSTPSDAASRTPPALDARIAQLAEEIVAGTTDPLAIANTLEAQLKRRYGYTLELPGAVSDPLADFLFVRRAGHCEDFATALAVMLRLKGIPSRVVTGFFGGELVGNRYVVRSGDAHAWVEAFIDGAWVRFDATPDLGRSASGSRLAAAFASAWEKVEEWWRSRVLDYSFQDQLSFARSLVRPPAPASDERVKAPTADRTGGLRVGVGLFGLALLIVGLWLRRKTAARLHPATTVLEQVEGRLKLAGVAQVDELPIEE
ncbi:MAG: DUF3488 domain-containing protein, partial [Archangium sp.]|nr:DUF3488 domain-containing protein [Archangium sp.]